MNDLPTGQRTKAILDALNKAIEEGPWGESNFLRTIGNRLRKIRDDFTKQPQPSEADRERLAALMQRVKLHVNQQDIFISLYCADGKALSVWEHVVAHVPSQIVSRPMYVEEADVQMLIKSKANGENEAYVVVAVNAKDIVTLSPEKVVMDKLGKPLVSLKGNAVHLNNIKRFVHQSTEYSYKEGRLVPVSAES